MQSALCGFHDQVVDAIITFL